MKHPMCDGFKSKDTEKKKIPADRGMVMDLFKIHEEMKKTLDLTPKPREPRQNLAMDILGRR